MKVNCDVQLPLMGSSLYQLLSTKVGTEYENAKSAHIFRDLVAGTAQVNISTDTITVRMHRRAHNPLLIAAGFQNTDSAIPWLQGKRLRINFQT